MGAHLAQLRLAGFKSFADPATLDILPGLTGLVGPNGCGKSNLVEALRWAMGEGRAGALRGEAMDDLIFAGTRTRPGRNAAEVTLTLEGRFPPPFADETRLQVARHLGRGSGSAYQVNGAEVRARDVRALFADLAGGARASAMVGQGGVAAVIAACPEERRGRRCCIELPSGVRNRRGVGGSILTLEAHLAIQAEPRPPSPHSQSETQAHELARV